MDLEKIYHEYITIVYRYINANIKMGKNYQIKMLS